MSTPIIVEKAFLYSLWSGKFRVFEGDIRESGIGGHCGLFGSRIKRFLCSKEPRVVYNAVVWLTERDDNLARSILVKYEENAIALLQEKIENHYTKISILQEDPK